MAKIRGLIALEGDLLDGASGTGAVPAAVKERSNVIGNKTKGYEATDYGTERMNNGMDHHRTQLLSEFC